MLEFYEVIHKSTGCGFCATSDGIKIKVYMIKRWHPVMIKEIDFNEKTAAQIKNSQIKNNI